MHTDSPLDEERIDSILQHARPNILRMALYQSTRDPDLERMELRKEPLRGGAFFAYVLTEEDAEIVRRKAREFLLGADSERETPIPSAEDQRRMMGMLTGEEITDEMFSFGREELALEEFPRAAAWSNGAPELPEDFVVAVIGAGASGVAAGVQLERLGIPYEVFERQSEIGGTWHLNHYPDARVDTSSFLYQFKFVKNYPWPEYFASQAEVKKYIAHVASEYGVDRHIVFDTELTKAVFDERTGRWDLELRHSNGAVSHRSVNAIISGAGQFATPRLPDIEGVETFRGPIFHTTAWDDSFDPSGKRIAILGNGSTGVQLMPKLAESASLVYQFQRTPQWISPMEQYREAIAPEVRWLFDHVPYYWNWYCYYSQVTTDAMQNAQEYDPEWQAAGGQISQANDGLRQALTSYIHSKLEQRPDLEAKVLPDYAPLARRLVVDNGWYDALLRDNVELVTEPIARFTEHGLETADGANYEVDAVVLAAGFDVSKYLWPTEYIGRDGVTMESAWAEDGPRAYLGLTVPGFPNLYMFYGPNSQPRSGAFLSWIEIWSRYAVQGIVHVLEQGIAAIDVREEVFREYNRELDERHDNLIWDKEAPKERNYYVNRFGRQNVNWSFRNVEYFARAAALDPDDYEVIEPAETTTKSED